MAPSGKWDAGLYDTKHAFVWEKARGLVELLAPQQGERILDLGCGTAQLSAEIATQGALVIGVDRSEEMIREARKKFPHLRLVVCDARTMPFCAGFDAIFSNAVLHWIPDADAVVTGIARALKPGGRFVAEFGGKGNIKRLMHALEGALKALGVSPKGANPWYYPGIADYAALLEGRGLEVEQAVLFDRPTKLEDGGHGLATWLRMFGESWVSRVPEAKRDAYVREVERLARPALWRTGFWEVDYRRLRIVARKSLP